jgi:polyhydroxyalkanoate synthesis repressor PhaR
MSDRNPVRLIKKYPNRRLYDTRTSTHLTLSDVRRLVVEGQAFQIVDAKSGADLTRSILLQIILEAESDGEPIFSSDMLKGIICFYGPFQGMLGGYLANSIKAVTEIQAQTGQQSAEAWSDFMISQVPMMQKLMGQYFEQSKQLYLNTQNMFGMFPGFPGAAGRADKGNEDDDEA